VSCNPKINLVDALFRVASFDLSASPFDMRVIPADVIALFYWAGWCDWLPGVHVDYSACLLFADFFNDVSYLARAIIGLVKF
jgi:hypothetical protein